MTLYIYRVGWICLAKNPFIRSRSMKNTSCTRILPRSVRLLQPTSQTGLLNLLPIPNSFCQHREGAAAWRGAGEQGAAGVGAHDIGGGLRGAGGGKRGRLGFFASPEGVNTEQDS